MNDQLWLAIYDPRNGMAQLNNVGVVSAATAIEAMQKARKLFNTTGPVYVTPVDGLHDGWSFYV